MANTPATPRTWVAANTLTAAQMNVDVRDNGDYLLTSKPNARVYNSGAISLATGSVTALTFDSERYDKGAGSHSTSSNTGRLTVPTSCGGVYLIGGNVSFASNSTGVRQIGIRINGSTTIAQVYVNTNSSADCNLSICTAYSLAAADYVELMAFQNSGGNLNVQVSAGSPEFWWVWQST